MLDLPVGVNKYFVVTAYRTLAKQYHPDKADPDDINAEDRFIELKRAQDVLSNDALRSYYIRFGDFNQTGELVEKDVMIYFIIALATYVLLFAIAFLVTFPPKLRGARDTITIFTLIIFTLELYLRFVEEETLFAGVWVLKYYVSYEHLCIFRGLFPPLLVISMIRSGTTYVSVDDSNIKLLRGILATNRAVIERTNEIVRCSSYLKSISAATAAQMKIRNVIAHDEMAATFEPSLARGDITHIAAKQKKQNLKGAKKLEDLPPIVQNTLKNNTSFNTYKDPRLPATVDGDDIVANPNDNDDRLEETRVREWNTFTELLDPGQRAQFIRLMNIVIPQEEGPSEASSFIGNLFSFSNIIIIAVCATAYYFTL